MGAFKHIYSQVPRVHSLLVVALFKLGWPWNGLGDELEDEFGPSRRGCRCYFGLLGPILSAGMAGFIKTVLQVPFGIL